ncbi:MAG: TRAP transporter small permease [Desulfatibacillaceae bacterium]|nr:TRAP transporter small permease [Desulfatibacillaceae bacterium]
MKLLEKISNQTALVLLYMAGAAVFAMMLLTCADVVLRFFRRPIPGTYELVAQLGGIAVAFAMAHTTAVKGHVAVSIVVSRFSARTQSILDGITALLGFGVFALASYKLALMGREYQLSNHVSATLQLPLYPIVYSIAVALSVVCLVLLSTSAGYFKKALS